MQSIRRILSRANNEMHSGRRGRRCISCVRGLPQLLYFGGTQTT